MMAIYYTNAPKDYDWYAKEIDADVGRLTSGIDTERPVRKISLDDANDIEISYQTDRYLSGLFPLIPEDQWEEWLRLGFAVAGGDEKSSDDSADEPPSPQGSYCADCGAIGSLEDAGTTCTKCGRGVLVHSAFCRHCGGDSRPDNDLTCPDCGRNTLNEGE